ncbi:globin domain-containing protein [Streptomyces roseolilacinus]|uniref:nitric oxide dioxygenase n=1 Tax=Streptomyces roseolilacinus TaxID=66904 RepID=A0A918EMX4_9ACTN|nr:globin domain-containing protein [Streptomyces roseolilacinus]GGQ19996.1 hemin transporter [Streptomyces roseolilacinus]
MLSIESASVIRATLPPVGGALDAITTRFYAKMFAEHPELLDGLFNRGNQAAGTQRRALAGSLAAFAGALAADPGARPDALLARIAHKHAAVGVTEEQYALVHTYLFAAIAEVLGDAVTPEVAAAWDEVYWLMAGALIAQEARLYLEAHVRPGHPWRRWTVVERREETADTVSFLLRPADGGPVPAARAGQYVSVRVPMPDGVRQLRQYSLSSAPDAGTRRITVKRVHGRHAPEGEVSNLLHRTIRPGDELTLSAPFGDVVLDGTDRPLLLVSAGIGCTPMVGMLGHLAATGSRRPVTVLHADRSPADHALRDETRRLVSLLPRARAVQWYERCPADAAGDVRGGLMDLDAVEVPSDAVVYLCGPLPFMRAARARVLERGVPASRVHYEMFGPDLWPADVTA